MLKYLALAFTFIGLLVLVLLLYTQQPIIITDSFNLTYLKNNQLVSLSGIVNKETYRGNTKYLIINNIELKCGTCSYDSYKNKNVSITGILSLYNNKKEIHILSIAINDK